jgi:hypothetical protein
MATLNFTTTVSSKLRCTCLAIIIRNNALNLKFPGGINSFVNRYKASCNDHITVLCAKEMDAWSVLGELKAIGMVSIIDFVTLDTLECEMWQSIHSGKVHRPFWFRTGAKWLKCSHRDGDVWVWYDEQSQQN